MTKICSGPHGCTKCSARAQIEQQAYSSVEIATRYHHRLVAMHVFPNGNGRHARLMADLLQTELAGQRFEPIHLPISLAAPSSTDEVAILIVRNDKPICVNCGTDQYSRVNVMDLEYIPGNSDWKLVAKIFPYNVTI